MPLGAMASSRGVRLGCAFRHHATGGGDYITLDWCSPLCCLHQTNTCCRFTSQNAWTGYFQILVAWMVDKAKFVAFVKDCLVKME